MFGEEAERIEGRELQRVLRRCDGGRPIGKIAACRAVEGPGHMRAWAAEYRAIEELARHVQVTLTERQHVPVDRKRNGVLSIPLQCGRRATCRGGDIFGWAGAPTLADAEHVPSRGMRVGRCVVG